MRSAPDPPRALARLDLRLALLLAGATAAFTSLLLCGLLVYALGEALEEQAALLDDAITAVAAATTADGVATPVALHRGVAYRVTDVGGAVIARAGAWAPDAPVWREPSLRAALGAARGDVLVHERQLSSGATVAAALPLAHFARERRELATRAVAVILLGLCGSVGLGLLGARRALRPMHAAFERMAAFSADVAHELRTHVNRVLNAAEVALATTRDARAKDEALDAIRASAEDMRRTIEQLLLLAAGEEGRLPLARETIDVAALLEELVSFYAPEAERLGKTITLAAPPLHAERPLAAPPLALHADRALVERAVANLLENALRHSAAGSRIRVVASVGDGTIAVAVEDSGPGIDGADAERIFERFVRLDAARAPGGAGLGLPIARMIARVHGGDLAVGPSALGGAAFRLTLAAA
jgi:signal transduction histidine kinase